MTVDPFSVVLHLFITVTKGLALKAIKGFAKTFKIPFAVSKGKRVLTILSKSAHATLIDLLKERMELYDVGVSLDLVASLLDATKWISYGDYFVCLDAGEVMNLRGKLFDCILPDVLQTMYPRSSPSTSNCKQEREPDDSLAAF
jgi:hypothetical protein